MRTKKVLSVLVVENNLSHFHQWKQVFSKGSVPVKMDWVFNAGDFVRMVMRKNLTGEKYDVVLCSLFLAPEVTGIDLWKLYRDQFDFFVLLAGISQMRFAEFFPGQERPMLLDRPWKSMHGRQVLDHVLRDMIERPAA